MAASATALRASGPLNPLRAMELSAGFEMPDIIEWIVSDKYLDRGQILYPRQATFLKIIFLQDELFTDFDYAVIDGWIQQFYDAQDADGYSNEGITPDIYDRIKICKAQGRKWFREVLAIWGRRGSKGYCGGLAGSYVLGHYLSLGDPQGHYGVDRSKQLAAFVFAGKREQAVKNLWGDLNNVISEAPFFAPYIAKTLGESLEVYSPWDFVRMLKRMDTGVGGDIEPTFLIAAKESTVMASRGPASFMQMYDEMAFVTRSVARADAGEVYESATPALDQFGKDAFIYEPSSPWQKIGKFRENYEKVFAKGPEGQLDNPQVFSLQLAGWQTYENWEIAHEIDARPECLRHGRRLHAIRFCPLKKAMLEYDEDMQALERANPEMFAVERRGHWASVMDAYLNEARIKAIWEPFRGEVLVQQDGGPLSIAYRAHGDPSKSGAMFGFAVGHIAGKDERDLPHVVFDRLHHWDPSDFEDHQIDYDSIANDIAYWMDGFMPDELTFDQFNSVATIQALQKHARAKRYPKRVTVYERPATAPLNWKTYETFKTAIGLGLIHAPYYEQANLELTYLQDLGGKVDHPTVGPVQTKDVADCMAIVTYELIGAEMSAFLGRSLAELSLGVSAPGGIQPFQNDTSEAHEALSGFSRRRTARRPLPPPGRPRRRY